MDSALCADFGRADRLYSVRCPASLDESSGAGHAAGWTGAAGGFFNRMARRLRDYHNSSLSQLRVSKQYIETLINSIDEPIICMDQQRTLYFINNEALDILNLKREEILGKPAQEIAMRNDLLRRLLVGMGESKEADLDEKKSAPLKIYADNKESYFQVKYLPVRMKGNESDHWCRATRRASRTALCAGFRSRHRSPLPREHFRALFPCAGH